ncbi:unnamed protein product [Urochloa decumbens]|uniref:PB1-like domain-containing protein n=1 Tax=Urochloa decumbens TaxID=240449 RepID=A0ABC8X904_9POAL
MTGMDSLDYISVRFHFGGSFISSDGRMQYVGGCSGMSYIDVDKFSLPELKGHLADHVVTTNVMRMHWFRPGNGLMLLVDDRACRAMADHMTDDGVAYVFVEDVSVLSNEAEDKADQWADDEAEHEKSRQSSED